MDHARLAADLGRLLSLRTPAVAIAFLDAPPAGVARVDRPAPAGCGYWRLAGEGQVFYTEASDHHGCPVGAHTHHVPLPPEVRIQLEKMIGTMVGLEYLTMDEIASIPTRRAPLRIAVYAPLARTPVPPDLVLVRGQARQLMLLAEAAVSAGVASDGATLGRPTCAVLPQAENSGRACASFGCVGNRVYTGTADDEGWYAVPAAVLERLVARLEVIARANAALETFHRGRASQDMGLR
jgi:uncharacterized protein (DUF169 family)